MQSVSIIIPTYGRPEKLRNCLAALAKQEIDSDLDVQVIIALDGESATVEHASMPAPAGTEFLSLPRCGTGAARNAAMRAARGELLIFAGDDTYAEPDWIRQHLQAHHLRAEPGMVVGRTDWMRWPEETVFDAMIRETSMIFFFHLMGSGKTYGFRHFWTCNASLPKRVAEEAGGFDERLRPYGLEDLEFAFRVERSGHAGVLYHSDAVNVHDHRMSWRDYCNREAGLGQTAACLSQVNLDCFEAIYDRRDPQRMFQEFQQWIELDRGDHEAAELELKRHLDRPAADVADWITVRDLLYRLHLPIKRRCFRSGFIKGYPLRDDAHLRERLALGHSYP